jgi:hypothetical protein
MAITLIQASLGVEELARIQVAVEQYRIDDEADQTEQDGTTNFRRWQTTSKAAQFGLPGEKHGCVGCSAVNSKHQHKNLQLPHFAPRALPRSWTWTSDLTMLELT